MLSASERAVLQEVNNWRNREPDWVNRQVERVNRPVRRLSDLIYRVPGVEWTMENLVSSVVRVTNEIAQDTVSWSGVQERFAALGYEVTHASDVRALGIDTINAALNGVQLRYQSLTGVQGAAAGFFGAAGIVPDLVGLIGFNLRAVGETALCCGFSLSDEHEREYALYTLNVAACSEEVMQSDAATAIARHHTRQTAEQMAVKGTMYGLARALGQRMISLKSAQVLPVAGMVVGGSSNAWYTARVCEAARHLYRERLLHHRYPGGIAGTPEIGER